MHAVVRALSWLLMLSIALIGGAAHVVASEAGGNALYFPLLKVPEHRLAFVALGTSGSLDLFTIRPDGGDKHQLLSTADHEAEPAWSPDGKQIAFSRWSTQPSADGNLDGRQHVFLIGHDGLGERKLADLLSSQSPAWSPDGTHLAFLGYTRTDSAGEPTEPLIYVARADGSGLRALTTRTMCSGAPEWSPDGHMIACSKEDSSFILLMNADGSNQRQLGGGISPVIHTRLTWSPDSTQLAYVVSSSGGHSSLVVQRVNGSQPVELLGGAERYADPQWSPDGQRIVFTTLVPAQSTYSQTVELINADGTRRARLLELQETRIEDPFWSPDGRAISFSALDNTTSIFWGIYVMGADGSRLRRISDGSAQSWQP